MANRRYRWFAPLAIVGMLSSGLVTYGLRRTPIVVRISEGELQRQIDAHLPHRSEHNHLNAQVRRVTIDLRDDGNVGFAAELELDAYGASMTGHVEGTAAPEYRDGAFYLAALKTTKIAVERVDVPHTDLVLARAAARKLVGKVGAAELDERRLIEGALPMVLVRLFSGRPIYRVKNTWKGDMTKRLLRSIRVEGDVLIVELRLG